MAHMHNIIDTDARFVIDPITRQIKNRSNGKITLMQKDHNSERFSFEIPRVIEGHDMTSCDAVEVHYFNVEDKGNTTSGIYTVEDLRTDPADESKAVFSWLISNNATQLKGLLKFLIRFKCVTDSVVTYSWNTAFFTGIYVGEGGDADELFESEYVDIIEQWKASVIQQITDEINASVTAWKEVESGKVRGEMTAFSAEWMQTLEVERKRIDQIVALPEGSTTGDAELMDIRIGADGVTYDSAGSAVREQISSVASALDIIKPINYAVLSNSDVLMNPNGFEVVAEGAAVAIKNLPQPVNGFVIFNLTGLQAGKDYSLSIKNDGFRNISIRTDTDIENEAPGNILVASEDDVNGEWSCTFTMPDKSVTLCFWLRYSATSAEATNISLVEYGAQTKSFVKVESLRDIGRDNLSEELNALLFNESPCDYDGDDICAFSYGICIGDSLTQGVFNYYADGVITNYVTDEKRAYPAYLQKLTNTQITNAGVGGKSSAEWYEEYKDEDLTGFDFAIIQLGVNDAYRHGGWSEISENAFASIVTKLKNENKNIKIFVSTIIPAKSYIGEMFDDISAGIRNFVSALADDSVILLDMATYGHTADETAYNCGHLSAYGYWRLAKDYKGYISWYMKNNPDKFAEIQFIGTDYEFADTN